MRDFITFRSSKQTEIEDKIMEASLLKKALDNRNMEAKLIEKALKRRSLKPKALEPDTTSFTQVLPVPPPSKPVTKTSLGSKQKNSAVSSDEPSYSEDYRERLENHIREKRKESELLWEQFVILLENKQPNEHFNENLNSIIAKLLDLIALEDIFTENLKEIIDHTNDELKKIRQLSISTLIENRQQIYAFMLKLLDSHWENIEKNL